VPGPGFEPGSIAPQATRISKLPHPGTGVWAGKVRSTYNLFAPQRDGPAVSLLRIDRRWTPVVRYAARRYRRDLRATQRRFERAISSGTSEGEAMSVLCAEQARAVLDLLNRLGYGGDRKKAPARDRLELELKVHELDEDASINFFRLFMAQRKGRPLEQVFSRRGREQTFKEADALRFRHIDELRAALKARMTAREWLSRYYGRFELGRKYREFARVQFDTTLDDEAKAAYMALLLAQVAQRTGRTKEDVLSEYNEMVRSLGIHARAEIDLDAEGSEEEAGEGG
jgi:hypothetical protein